jgi:hypothetical protein
VIALRGDCGDTDLARLQQADPDAFDCIPGRIGDRPIVFVLSGRGNTDFLRIVDLELATVAPRVALPMPAHMRGDCGVTPVAKADLDYDGSDELVLRRELEPAGIAVQVVAVRDGSIVASAEEQQRLGLPRDEDVGSTDVRVETLEVVAGRLLRGPLTPLR